MLLTSRYLPELKWYLLVELREQEAIKTIEKSLIINLAVSAGVILAIALMLHSVLNRYQRRLDELASTDKLSGLGNRQYFDMSLGPPRH